MKQVTKEALYIIAIVASSFIFFHLGQVADNKCAAAISAKRKAVEDSLNKAANAKINFCLRNRPSLNNPRNTLEKYRLFKEINCPQRLLYADCDQTCREEIFFNVKTDLEINNWDADKIQDPDDLFEMIGAKPEGLPLPDEDFRPEP